jgi:SAM-dependent methyltransferase
LIPGPELRCPNCPRTYPVTDSIADFSGGHYFDSFSADTILTPEQQAGLDAEVEGSLDRIESFYAPALRQAVGAGARILDSGCGNGVSLEALGRHGYEAWGHDLSQLRLFQWRNVPARERLCVADGRQLPFPGAFFDAVLSSGVIEHIGVVETRGEGTYTIRPKAGRDDERRDYLRELLRVTRPGGAIFLDCPNGAFPIDFWHGVVPGQARFHRRAEGFLPTFREVRGLVRDVAPHARVEALSAHRRLRFRQVGRHWYGRVFAFPMDVLMRMSILGAGRFLRTSPLMPYLVVRITA